MNSLTSVPDGCACCSTPSERTGSLGVGQGLDAELAHDAMSTDYGVDFNKQLQFKRSKQRRIMIDECTSIESE